MVGESDAEEGGQRRQMLLEMQWPVLLFCQLCSAGQSSGFLPFSCQKLAVLANVPVLMQLYHLKRTLLPQFALSPEPV